MQHHVTYNSCHNIATLQHMCNHRTNLLLANCN